MLTVQEKAGLTRGIKKSLKYQLGYCYKCKKCNITSRVHLRKHKRSLSEKWHLENYHPELSHADLERFYVYGNIKQKITVLMNQKEFLFFTRNPKKRKEIDNIIDKRK